MRPLLFSFLLLGASPALAGQGAAPAAAGCNFLDRELPADTIVIAAGGYGGRTLAFQIDQTGHEATQFDVAVHADKPVALLLGAYEPTIWSIAWTSGTRIVAVYVTGYHRQAVAGLPPGTPLIVSSYDGKGACGSDYISDSDKLAWINPKARMVFGKAALRVYNKAPGGLLDIVESARAKSAYQSAPDVTPASLRDKNAPLAGNAGLADAVAKGVLRPMTEADIEKVRRHFRAALPRNAAGKPDVPPLAGAARGAPAEVSIPSISLERGYVVLKRFVYPAGLYGGNLAYFIVPKGVPAPTGEPGHSTVIDLGKPGGCATQGCH